METFMAGAVASLAIAGTLMVLVLTYMALFKRP
jgi:hypothetical protein